MAHWMEVDPTPSAMHTLGFAGFGVSLVGVFGYLPIAVTIFAGVAGGISYTLSIFRDPGVQMWLAKRRARRQDARMRKLKTQQLIVQAQIAALETQQAVKAATEAEVKKVVTEATKSSQPQSPSHG